MLAKLTQKVLSKVAKLAESSRSKRWHNRLRLGSQLGLPGFVAIALIMLVRMGGTFQVAEWYMFDRFMRYRLPEQLDKRIVIVGITERDIPKAGFPITDAELAKLIERINSFQPQAIGLDIFRDLPVASGREKLRTLFKNTKNLVVIEKSVLPDDQNTFISPPPELPPEQVGFADILLDEDGHIRRSLLAGSGRLSLAAKLSALYLANLGWNLENGISDRSAFRFVSNLGREQEIRRFLANDGGYVRSDSFGNQILLNWRNSDRFPIISLYDQRFNSNPAYKSIYDRQFDPNLIRNRIVLVGYIAPFSAKDTVTVPAISDQPIYGVEFHAYSISQVLSSVLDNRSGISSLPEVAEYFLIAIAGIIGIWIAANQTSAIRSLVILSLTCGLFTQICYGAILISWWLPVVPVVLACGLSGLVTRYVNDLRSLIVKTQELSAQRQQTLDEAFNALHNGPLHSLAELISKARENELEAPQLSHKLENLDRELRQVYETLRPDSMHQEILAPLHELVAEVMHRALQRDFIGYKQLKFTIPDIHPVDDSALTAQQKRELCSFLDEALCNVGKHAIGSTRLRVVCKQEAQIGYLQVIDNGVGIAATGTTIKARGGTNHAIQLAKQLGGSFRREPYSPKGTICEISWSIFGK